MNSRTKNANTVDMMHLRFSLSTLYTYTIALTFAACVHSVQTHYKNDIHEAGEEDISSPSFSEHM